MNAKQYVNAIVEKIKCSGAKKKEIEKQLLLDINMRLEQGERLEDIISQMGTAKEIADSFNENMSAEEKKRYFRNKILKIVGLITIVLALMVFGIYRILPKSYDIEKSKYFNKAVVEEAMKETVELLDVGDYAALQENAITEIKPSLNSELIEGTKKNMSEDWGERKQFGAIYLAEYVQGNTHFAVGEITVTYENISVIYRLTYDKDMKLAGLYMR